MTVPEFLRLFPMRAPNLMWFLGAGASAATGIPTAGDMIWDFKRRLYCSEQRVSIHACQDLADPDLRAKLQRHLDSQAGNPKLGGDEEYSHYFTAVFPAEADRRKYIEQMIASAIPSLGHTVIGLLMKNSLTRVIWTTNFDRNVENAVAKVMNTTSALVVGHLETTRMFQHAIQEQRWPVLGKVHGDFQSRSLKNTSAELQTQDAEMRRLLVNLCKNWGLVVIGYSGRDKSIMETLEEAFDDGRGYPSGLFWITRATPSPAVAALLARGRSLGIEAHALQSETFDEFLGDVIGQLPNIPPDELQFLSAHKKKCTEAPVPDVKGSWPVLRLNAVRIRDFPSVCRVLECDAGGTSEVLSKVKSAGAPLIATRKKQGVLFFGSDADAQRVFEDCNIRRFDVYTIENRRLWYDSAEQGLMYDALCSALAREHGLSIEDRSGSHTAYAAENVGQHVAEALKQAVGEIRGTVPGTATTWCEAISLNLSYRRGSLWLVFEPTIWTTKPKKEETDAVREFQRERQAGRYNRKWNGLLEAWADGITFGKDSAELRALGVDGGHDAKFVIERTTAFSRRRYS